MRRQNDGARMSTLVDQQVTKKIQPANVESGVRLFHKEDSRIVKYRSRQRGALLETSREGSDAVTGAVSQSDLRDESCDPVFEVRNSVQATIELKILANCQLVVQERLVRDVADVPPDRGALTR